MTCLYIILEGIDAWKTGKEIFLYVYIYIKLYISQIIYVTYIVLVSALLAYIYVGESIFSTKWEL